LPQQLKFGYVPAERNLNISKSPAAAGIRHFQNRKTDVKSLLILSTAVGLATPELAFASHRHHHKRLIVVSKHHIGLDNGASDATTTKVLREPPVTPAPSSLEVSVDAKGGKPLKQVLADLRMEAEWGRESLGDRVVVGSYHGSPQVIAQELLGNLNYAIYRERSQLRVVVLPESPKEIPKQAPRQDDGKREGLTKSGI
jgi:hypothetical protein